MKEESEVGVVVYIYIIPSKRINNMIPNNQVFLGYSSVQKSFLCQYPEFAFERGAFPGGTAQRLDKIHLKKRGFIGSCLYFEIVNHIFLTSRQAADLEEKS